ncbi:radical SAM protein [Dehalogenimonas sp. THU2]|uniref:radical SAM protein n=1 Tax=Dehalogenimonas sp. THU2 TaxID=3151121 RepID=UPI00321835DA
MKTNIYHITYTPDTRSASLRFWGCNMICLGCLCKEGVYDHLLKENRLEGSQRIVDSRKKPERMLDLEEVIEYLSGLELERVFFTGEEASVDPHFGTITKVIHEKFHTENVLYTNGYDMASIDDIDTIEVGIKAISEDLHLRYTGRPVGPVKENFIKYAASGKKLTAASILIPGLVEAEEIEKIALFIASVNKDIPFFVLPYFPAGDNPWRKTEPWEVEEAAQRVRKYLTHVSNCQGTDQEIVHDVERVF